MRRALLVSVLFAPLLTACVNTDAAVFVEAHLINPAATVTAETLGTSLQGQALLAMHLGARSSGGSEVTLGAFNITNADETMTLVPSLPVAPSSAQPFAVASDSDVDVTLTFDTGANLLPAAIKNTLCGGASIAISGVIQDSLQTSQTPVVSIAFSPTCK